MPDPTPTPNLGLLKIVRGSIDWDQRYNGTLDILDAKIPAGDAATLTAAKAYTDLQVGSGSTIEDELAAETAARVAGDTAEATARTSAISTEATLRMSGDVTVLSSAHSYTDTGLALKADLAYANDIVDSLSSEVTARTAGDVSAVSAAATYTDDHIAPIAPLFQQANSDPFQVLLDGNTVLQVNQSFAVQVDPASTLPNGWSKLTLIATNGYQVVFSEDNSFNNPRTFYMRPLQLVELWIQSGEGYQIYDDDPRNIGGILTVNSNGKVGINVIDGSHDLDIVGNADINNSGNDTVALTIRGSEVGSLANALEVSGNVHFSANATIDGIVITHHIKGGGARGIFLNQEPAPTDGILLWDDSANNALLIGASIGGFQFETSAGGTFAFSGGNLTLTGGSIGIPRNFALYLDGVSDKDWGVGVNPTDNGGWFTTTHATSNILKIVYGIGGEGISDGFAIGVSGRTSTLELDQANKGWFLGDLDIAGVLTNTGLTDSLATKLDITTLNRRQADTGVLTAVGAGLTVTGTVNLGKSFVISRILADKACRIELYQTAAQQAADASRDAGTPPTPGTEHGVILDLVLAPELSFPYNWKLSPSVIGSDLADTPTGDITYAITNTDVSAQDISVSFAVVTLET